MPTNEPGRQKNLASLDTTATWEEAKCCPKCGTAGNDFSQRRAPNGNGYVHMLRCENALCPWNNSSWVVQVDRDGNIPKRNVLVGGGDLAPLSTDALMMGRRILEDIVQEDLRGREG